MGYSSKIFSRARAITDERRAKAISDCEERKEQFLSDFPRAAEIKAELASCGASAGKAVVNGGDVCEQLSLLKEKSLALQKELNKLLSDNGYPEDYLEPQFSCHVCQDRGSYEENNKTLICDCFRRTLISCACEELNASAPLELSTFDSFDLSLYSKTQENGTSPYSRMSKIYDFCKKYAADFSTKSESLLFTGATGLGKTHLSLAIANEVIRKGCGVIYAAAPSICERLESLHFSYSYSEEQQSMDALTDCDLLIIDDLATEFSSSYSKTALYNLFNSRLLKSKPTVINTNLNFKELEKFYSPRFVSRLYGEYTRLDFIGKDIRIASKQAKLKAK